MNYTGIQCPVCGKAFKPNDDIVVCPDCGAPYHRECFEKAGGCIFTDRHGTSFTWTPPRQKPPYAEAPGNSNMKRCPRCGAPNPKTALFCSHCGQPLTGNRSYYGSPYYRPGQAPGSQGGPSQQGGPSSPQNPGGYPPYGGYPGGPVPFGFDPLGGIPPTQEIDGVPAGDLAKFVQSNTPYYLPVFRNLKLFGKGRFNFSSFFFTGIWLLYRKQYRLGAIFAAVMGTLSTLYFYLSYLCYPIYLPLMEQAGISSASPYGISGQQWIRLSELIYSLPVRQQMLLMSPGLILLIRLVLMIICGFIGNRTYLKFSLEKVKRIRREAPDEESANARFREEGGVNTAVAVLFGICLLILSFFFFE